MNSSACFLAMYKLLSTSCGERPPGTLPGSPIILAGVAGMGAEQWGASSELLLADTVMRDGRVHFTRLVAYFQGLDRLAAEQSKRNKLNAAARWGQNGSLRVASGTDAGGTRAASDSDTSRMRVASGLHTGRTSEKFSASPNSGPGFEAQAGGEKSDGDANRGAGAACGAAENQTKAKNASDSAREQPSATRQRRDQRQESICRRFLESITWEGTVPDEFFPDDYPDPELRGMLSKRGGAKFKDKISRGQLNRLISMATCTPVRCHMLSERVKRGEGSDNPATWVQAGFTKPYEITEADQAEYRRWYAASEWAAQDRIDEAKQRVNVNGRAKSAAPVEGAA